MSSDSTTNRYQRQIQLPGFGKTAQDLLGQSSILVVGAGGLGVPALQYLCGMGLGRIGIVDDDVVQLSNLPRQVLYSTDDIGKHKSLLAKEKLLAMNPEVHIDVYVEKLLPQNALELIRSFDLVLDATDNFSARYLINDACVLLDKPFVYAAVHQFEGQVSVFNFKGGPSYRCLYPQMPGAMEVPDCNVAGVLGVIPGLIGCRQALEAIKIITGIGKNLSGELLVIDFLRDQEIRVQLKRNPRNFEIKDLADSYELPECIIPSSNFISPQQLREWYQEGRDFQVLDIREPSAFQEAHLPRALQLELSNLEQSFNVDNGGIVIYCQKGNRSKIVAQQLRDRHPRSSIYELIGGIENWLNHYPNDHH